MIEFVVVGAGLFVMGVALGMDTRGRAAREETLREVVAYLRQRAIEEALYGGSERGWPYRDAAARIEAWLLPDPKRGPNRRKEAQRG